MQAAGIWVFGGGLLPSDSATVVRVQNGADHHDRRSVRRDEGAARRVLGDRGRRPRRRRWSGPRSAPVACGAPIEVRPFDEASPDRAPVDIVERLPGGVRPLRGHPDPRPRRHRARRGGRPGRVRGGRAEVGRSCRPTPAPGSSPPPATGPSTACAASPPARPGTPRRCCCTNPTTSPRRWDRCATTSCD